MKLRTLAVLSLSATTLILTSCKKEEPAAPTPAAPPAPAAPAAAAATPKPAAAASDGFTPAQAKDHVGEVVSITGKIFGVHVTAKEDVFINVGAAYPNAPFTIVRFHSNEAIAIDDLKPLDGKTVTVTGKIKDHNSQIEIILDTLDQIKVDGKALTPKPAAPKADAPAAEAPKADAPAVAAPKADDRPN